MNKPFLPEDLVPKSFIDHFGSRIKCALGGGDRLRFHASRRPLFSPQWMRTELCAAQVPLKDFAAHGLIRKLPHTHRYLGTESGRAVLTALVAAQQASTEKLTPALAA
jgi:hypothetical protein